MNTLLLIGSFVATAATLTVAILLVVFPYGGRWAGAFLLVMSAVLSVAGATLAREEWGWRRRRTLLRAQAVARHPAVRRVSVTKQTRRAGRAPTGSPQRRPASPQPSKPQPAPHARTVGA